MQAVIGQPRRARTLLGRLHVLGHPSVAFGRALNHRIGDRFGGMHFFVWRGPCNGETLPGPTVHHNTASYNPTDLCGYYRPDDPQTPKVKAAAKDFFLGRPVDVIEGRGAHLGAYEFDFDFAIVLDTKNGLIFSFVWNLAD